MTANRRQFSRILFQSEAVLSVDGAADIQVSVVDISLKGALVEPMPAVYTEVGSAGTLTLQLSDAEALISMDVTVAHHQGPYLGLACRRIDLDSMTHLRRLIELNLGDEATLNRELSALTAHSDTGEAA